MPRFGHHIYDGRPFWIGDFDGNGHSDVLFYYPGDDNWWLGSHQGPGGRFAWSFAGNTAGFGHGINDGRPFWLGDFNGNGRTDVLFYYPGDDNWWLGSHSGPGGQLQWSFAGNTAGFGHGINDGRPFWLGDFNGNGRSDVLFYYPGDDNWWVGSHDGNVLQWSFAGNTAGFGHGINDGRPFWTGRFSRSDRDEVLFYYPGDDNWWLGVQLAPGTPLAWEYAGNTGYDWAIRLHVKILTDPSPSVDDFLAAMRTVYDTVGGRVDFVDSENLGGIADFTALNDLEVGACVGGTTTAEQNELFGHQNNVGANEVVVYFVRSTTPPLGGCAASPAGEAKCVVVDDQTEWVAAHEVGHLLGLAHVNDSTRLMNPNQDYTHTPPLLTQAEGTTMASSPFSITL